MRIIRLLPIFLVLVFSACKKQETKMADVKYAIDSTRFDAFFKKYPEFADYQKGVRDLYRQQQYEYIWYAKDGRGVLAEVLFDRARQIAVEGVDKPLPYREAIGEIIESESDKPDQEHDLLFSSMYLFYAKHVYQGVDPRTSRQLGWYLPRARVAYADYLQKLMDDPSLVKEDDSQNIRMYYDLRKALRHYREIEAAGGWKAIDWPNGAKQLKLGHNGPEIVQLRKRLVFSGDLASDSGSSAFDQSLEEAVKSYQSRHGLDDDGIVTPEMVKNLNIPVSERIKTIVVNMERCRWLSPEMTDGQEFISVNIPSYRMIYVRDGKPVLKSNVVVGKVLHKTVVFSGKMSYLVFSPYWNIPKSIIRNEIEPAMASDENYLEKHNMEWNDGKIRQKPGKDNALGLVKFMFPNSNNIYLHDSPAKSLFNKEERAFSHGCVRVQKARELALEILKGDSNWNERKVDAAMNAGKESQYTLKRKIPVYIAYFTALADASAKVAFFDDVYSRDGRLAKILYDE